MSTNEFKIRKGNTGLTSGVHKEKNYWCVGTDTGSITATWVDASTSVIVVPAGGAITFKDEPLFASATITASTFHKF